MSLVEWKDEEFSVGIAKVDQQHKALVALINKLYENRGSKDPEFVDEVLAELSVYAREHFAYEEKFLAKLHYPGTEGHQQKHTEFIRKLYILKSEFAATKETEKMIEAISLFLKNWLMAHILVEDKAYGKFLFD